MVERVASLWNSVRPRDAFLDLVREMRQLRLRTCVFHELPSGMVAGLATRLAPKADFFVSLAEGYQDPGSVSSYRYLADRLRVTPGRLLVVGDDVLRHIHPGRRAGCPTVLVWDADSGLPQKVGPTVVAARLTEVTDLVKSILSRGLPVKSPDDEGKADEATDKPSLGVRGPDAGPRHGLRGEQPGVDSEPGSPGS